MTVDIDRWVTLTVNYQMADGEASASVFSYKSPIANPTAAQLVTMCQDWWTQNGTPLKNTLASTVAVTSLVARTKYNPPYVEGSYTGIFPQYGNVAGDALPNNASEMISWRTGSIGPKYRGRNFIPAGSETTTTSDRFLSSLTVLMGTLAASLIVGFTSGGQSWFPVVASRVGHILTFIQSGLADYFIKSQEDRLPKHRKHHH